MACVETFDALAAIPSDLERQVRRLLAKQWPGPDLRDDVGPLIDPGLHPTYFVIAEDGALRGYGRTIWARVVVGGQMLKLYGLGDVVTDAEHRCQGYGSLVGQAATAYIVADEEADAAILLTDPALRAFYGRRGWVHMPGLRVATDESASAFAMGRLVSQRAEMLCGAMNQMTLVLQGDEW